MMTSKRLWGWLVIAGLVLGLSPLATAQISGKQNTSTRANRSALGWNASPAAASGASTTTASTDPQITFFGVTRADDVVADSDGTVEGIPVYLRLAGSGFSLVVEGKPGSDGTQLGTSSFSSDDVNQLPDLQVEVSRPLGDGSATVCDDGQVDLDGHPSFGGVPAVSPFDFSPAQAPAINDFACRFKNGQGQPIGRIDYPCTRFLPDLEYRFVDSATKVQFCGVIDKPFAFPIGDTTVAARVRDIDGNVSTVAQLIIRVATPLFSPTATRTPTASPTPTSTAKVPAAPPRTNFADTDGCALAPPRQGARKGAIFGLLPLLLVCRRRRGGKRTPSS